MSARARRPTDLGVGAGAVDMRGEYAPQRTVPPHEDRVPEPFEDPTDVGPRSEPIRVISMKDQTEAQKRQSDEVQAPLHVQLRSLAEATRRRADTPVGLGHLAPPRDPRQARVRRLRANLRWACVAIVLAGAISFAIWLIAGR